MRDGIIVQMASLRALFPIDLFRSAGSVDIFCGNTDAANWLARGLGEDFIRDSLMRRQRVRILVSDSVRRVFDGKVAQKLPIQDIRGFQDDWKHFLSRVKEWRGCKVRRASFDQDASWIVLDRETAFMGSDTLSLTDPSFIQLAAPAGPALADFFDRIWNPDVSVLYQDLLATMLAPAAARLLGARSSYWEELIEQLATDPQRLHEMPPREFEQLVFELLIRDGFECLLTPATRDGGYDILARYHTPVGPVIYLVECNHFGPQRPVGVSIVRGLYGVVENQRANAGLIVTTSHLSPDAISLTEELRYRMEAREYDELVTWLKKHSGTKAKVESQP